MLSNETRDELKRELELVEKNEQFWTEQIAPYSEKLQQLSIKPENLLSVSDFEEMERLEGIVSKWSKRAYMESQVTQKTLQKIHNVLLNNFCSGVMQIRWK